MACREPLLTSKSEELIDKFDKSSFTCASFVTFAKPTSDLVVFAFMIVEGALPRPVSIALIPLAVTCPPPAPDKVPSAAILTLEFLIVLGAFVKSVLTAPNPTAVTEPPPAPDKAPAALIEI